MVEAILLVVCFGLVMFIGIRETKLRKDRESHEWWVSEVKECVHSIECDFRRDCEKIITTAFSGKNVSGEIVIGEYSKEITALKSEYMNRLTEKAIARMGQYRITSVPETIAKEYERNISEIADTFRYFGDFMLEQIKDTKKGAYHWKMTY